MVKDARVFELAGFRGGEGCMNWQVAEVLRRLRVFLNWQVAQMVKAACVSELAGCGGGE